MTAAIVVTLACLLQTVRDDAQLRDALRSAKAGTVIRIAPGTYRGDVEVRGIAGEPKRPIVVTAADPKEPPLFEGGAVALHLSEVAWIELSDLGIRGPSGNGINVDDGGHREKPSHHVALRRLVIRDVGKDGNQDGIKLSGVDDFSIEGCTVERWGGGGSGIDLVGCHRGTIESSTFRDGGGRGGNGVQAKGGSSDVTIRRCRFEEAGARAINLGGSTGLEFFRPPLAEPAGSETRSTAPPHAEARDLVVEGCTILGSDAAIAFVGVDGASVRFNTIWVPRRWAIRVLQETTAPGFAPCRGGEFRRNLVLFRSDRWSEGGVNVGPGTDPKSFVFDSNWWFCVDAPQRSEPTLPTAERDGVRGQDPRLRDPEKGDLRPRDDSKAKEYGAEALSPAAKAREDR